MNIYEGGTIVTLKAIFPKGSSPVTDEQRYSFLVKTPVQENFTNPDGASFTIVAPTADSDGYISYQYVTFLTPLGSYTASICLNSSSGNNTGYGFTRIATFKFKTQPAADTTITTMAVL